MGSHYGREKASLTVTVHVDATQTFTTVLVDDGEYVGLGTAKRNPRDEFDQVLGQKVAGARALSDLAATRLAELEAELGHE